MKLAVIGDPVSHSGSPAIHARLLREAGIEGTYEAIRVPAGEAAAAIAGLATAGYTGCNVTSPLKEEAAAACDELTPQARRANAVNTIVFRGEIVGTTTDGIGAARSLEARLGALRGRRIAVLGTGPTARAVVVQLREEKAKPLLWGRDTAKVLALCKALGATGFLPGERDLEAAFCALLPNASLPPALIEALRAAPLVIDANYGERATLGDQLGRQVVDGSAMLEAQARASFDFWRASERAVDAS
ncbi:MAG TPA: hypothetical protein VIN40_11275 [Candidatus Tyrphobacter sp.]